MSSAARGAAVRKVVLAVAFATLGVRLFLFIHKYAVNIMFWDQWDFWGGMFQGADWWTLFNWQHGLQREGLGYVVIKLTALASDWDTKTEAYVTGALFVAATAVALAIKWRLTRRWSMFDVCIPLVILTIGNVETYAGTTNPSHGPMPLVLVRLLDSPAARGLLTVVLDFFAVFTGFSDLFGPIVSFLLLLDLIAAIRERRRVAFQAGLLAASGAVLALFSRQLGFAPAVACFVFPDPHPIKYAYFVGGLALRALQLHDLQHGSVPIGALTVAAWLGIVLWSTWGTLRSLGRSTPHAAVFALSSYCWLFSLNAAIGRVCLGQDASLSSRYVSYTLLQLFAAYLAIQSSIARESVKAATLSLVLFLCIVKEVRTKRALGEASWYAQGKQRWKDCYLQKEDVAACNRETGYPVYPDPAGLRPGPQLKYLKEHGLNLFKKGE
jgi:hypothetical protein